MTHSRPAFVPASYESPERGHPAHDSRWHWVRSGLRAFAWGWVPHLFATLLLLVLLQPTARLVLGDLLSARALWGTKVLYLTSSIAAVVGLIEVARAPEGAGVRPFAWGSLVCFLVSMVLQAIGVGAVRWVAERTVLPLEDLDRLLGSTRWLLSPLAEALGVLLLLAALSRVVKAAEGGRLGVKAALLALLVAVELTPPLAKVLPQLPVLPPLALVAVRLAADALVIALAGGAAASLWMAPRPARRVEGEPAEELFYEDWRAPRAGLGLYTGALRAALALFVLETSLSAVGAEALPPWRWATLSLVLPLVAAALTGLMAMGLARYARVPAASGGKHGAWEAVALLLAASLAHLARAGLIAADRSGQVIPWGITLARSVWMAEDILPLFAMLALAPSFRRVSTYVGWPEIAWRAAGVGVPIGAAIAGALLAHFALFSRAVGPRASLLLALVAIVLGVVSAARHLGIARLLRAALHRASEPPPEPEEEPLPPSWENWGERPV